MQIYKKEMWDIESEIRHVIDFWGMELYASAGISIGVIQKIYQSHLPSDSFNGIYLHDTDVSL